MSTGDLIRGWEAAKMANLPSPGQDIQDEDIFLGIFMDKIGVLLLVVKLALLVYSRTPILHLSCFKL